MGRLGLALALASSTASAEPRQTVSLDAAFEIGVLSASHATLTGAYAHELWGDRMYVEARVGLGTTGSLLMVEERAGIGFVFHPSKRVELLVGWRIGHTWFTGEIADAEFSAHTLAAEMAVQIVLHAWRDWNVHAAPLVPSVFWHRTYAGSVGLEAGAGYAF